MAKTPKVRLYIRIRRSNGTDAFVDPAWNRNRTLREGYALIEGELEHHPKGVYYLRFLRYGKRIWERIGQDADAAVVALRNTEHDLQSMVLGRSAPLPVVSPRTSVSPHLSVPPSVAALEAGVSPDPFPSKTRSSLT
jgi:hypothetical protein